MKKTIIPLLLIITLLLSSCGNSKSIKEANYETNKLIYLSILSSSTKDYFEEGAKDLSFEITDNTFKLIAPEDSNFTITGMEYEDVTYEEFDSEGKIDTGAPESIDISGYESLTSYEVLSNGEKTGFRLYELDDKKWISHYNIINEDTEFLDYVFEIKEKADN
jgi:major membrane immunogen (membrane-anchored lipoprotein)